MLQYTQFQSWHPTAMLLPEMLSVLEPVTESLQNKNIARVNEQVCGSTHGV